MKLIATVLFLTLSTIIAEASQFFGEANIKSIDQSNPKAVVIEFVALNKNNFSTLPDGTKKLKFNYLNWPRSSRNRLFLEKLMFWKKKTEYKEEEFNSCLNWIIQQGNDGKSVMLGQTGGGEFEMSGEAVIVPFMHSTTTEDGKVPLCLIDLG